LSNKITNKDFVEFKISGKDNKLLEHLLEKEQRRERRRLRKVKKLTNKKKQNNFVMGF